jgi:DNA-binding MarR family transcriptional regulator
VEWRHIFEVATREPHFRILTAASASSLDQEAAAAANGSTKQSVSRPLKELEETDLIRRRRQNRRDEFTLTDRGASVRAVLAAGPPLTAGSWLLMIRAGPAEPAAVRRILRTQSGISVRSCAGDFDFLVVHEDVAASDESADLAYVLRNVAAEVARQSIVRPVF